MRDMRARRRGSLGLVKSSSRRARQGRRGQLPEAQPCVAPLVMELGRQPKEVRVVERRDDVGDEGGAIKTADALGGRAEGDAEEQDDAGSGASSSEGLPRVRNAGRVAGAPQDVADKALAAELGGDAGDDKGDGAWGKRGGQERDRGDACAAVVEPQRPVAGVGELAGQRGKGVYVRAQPDLHSPGL